MDVGKPTALQHHGFFSASAEIRRLAWRGRGGPWHPPWVTESPMRGVSIAGHDPWLGWWGYPHLDHFTLFFYLLGKTVYGDGSKHIKTILPKTARGWHGTSIEQPVGELRGRRDNKQPGIGQRGLGIEARTDWISKDLLQEKNGGVAKRYVAKRLKPRNIGI